MKINHIIKRGGFVLIASRLPRAGMHLPGRNLFSLYRETGRGQTGVEQLAMCQPAKRIRQIMAAQQ